MSQWLLNNELTGLTVEKVIFSEDCDRPITIIFDNGYKLTITAVGDGMAHAAIYGEDLIGNNTINI